MDLAKSLAAGLREVGFRTHCVNDGLKAINCIMFSKPAAIILDLALPRLSGIEICGMVRQTEEVSGTPILIISGHTGAADKLQLFELGADDYVTKPFGVKEVIARLRAVLKRSLLFHPRILVPHHSHH